MDRIERLETATALGVPQSEQRRRTTMTPAERWFTQTFEENYPKLYRYLHRMSGDLELAAETAQEAFVRLYRRRPAPDDARAWVFTVGINLMRNAKTKSSRRRTLLTQERSTHVLSDPPGAPDAEVRASEVRGRVRRALEALPERDRQLLLLRAEGFRYQELAELVGVKSVSVGTQLKRAKEAFRKAYEGTTDAP